MLKRIVISLCFTVFCVGLVSCASNSRKPYNYAQNQPLSKDQQIWTDILQQSSRRLYTIKKRTTNNPTKSGWIDLALIAKLKSRNTQELVREILAWREQYPNHPGNKIIPNNRTLTGLLSQTQPQQLAVLLPQSGKYSSIAKTVRSGILNAYYKNASIGVKQKIKFYDTEQDGLQTAYMQALQDGADFIIGPLTKSQVDELVDKVSLKKPTLALNYTKPTGYFGFPSNLYEFGLKPEDEVTQVSARARRAGLSRAIVIAPTTRRGKRLTSVFLDNWQASGGTVVDSLYFKPGTNFTEAIPQLLKVNVALDKRLMRKEKNKKVLSSQRRQDFDVIFLFTKPAQAHDIVPMLRYYYTGRTPIFATSTIYGGNPNASRNVDLNGVIVCDIPSRVRSDHAKSGMPSKRLFAVGKDAYTLSQNITRLNQLPHFPIYGATGALVMSNAHQVYRRIPCTPIRNVV